MIFTENKTTLLTNDLLNEILCYEVSPCLSLYQTTHRHFPENQQDRIRYGNLVKELETSLVKEYSGADAQNFLAPFKKLADDAEFWNKRDCKKFCV